MGKSKQKLHRHGRHHHHHEDEDPLPSSVFDLPSPLASSSLPLPLLDHPPSDHTFIAPCKHQLYQLFVQVLFGAELQSPKGDLSYLQKFYFTYVGGRSPVHLREDFCGTALICAEWVKGSIQRVATGLDFDVEALSWGIHNNVKKLGEDACSRVRLFHGNVLEPISMAQIIQTSSGDLVTEGKAVGNEEFPAVLSAHCRKHDRSENENGNLERDGKYSDAHSAESVDYSGLEKKRGNNEREGTDCRDRLAVTISWPGVDIVCALNYSCCCLQKRSDLVSYFKHVLEALSDRGGIFVMDIYGGVSSECPLKLRRHLQDFTYIWEQEAFDVINRTTRISLHFQLKNNRMLRQAFTYHWRFR